MRLPRWFLLGGLSLEFVFHPLLTVSTLWSLVILLLSAMYVLNKLTHLKGKEWLS